MKIHEEVSGLKKRTSDSPQLVEVTWRRRMRRLLLKGFGLAIFFGLLCASLQTFALPLGLTWSDTGTGNKAGTLDTAAPPPTQIQPPSSLSARDIAFGSYGTFFKDPVAQTLTSRSGKLSVESDPIFLAAPLPGTLWLIAIGFAGLVASRRSRR
jgi:hypothetical protein